MNAPILLLDPESPLSPYEQIASQIRIQVAAERLLPGEALPSVRQLARDLEIAPNTVVRAYNELVQEGWITPTPRRGFLVAQQTQSLVANERRQQLQRAIQQVLHVTEQFRVSPEELFAELERQVAKSQVVNLKTES
jgi:GntR family transcriptional regulator